MAPSHAMDAAPWDGSLVCRGPGALRRPRVAYALAAGFGPVRAGADAGCGVLYLESLVW
jgi:hypothetical protein